MNSVLHWLYRTSRDLGVSLTSQWSQISHVYVILCGTEWYFYNETFEIERYARKRIKHECSVRTENSVPRVTVWHHEAFFGICYTWKTFVWTHKVSYTRSFFVQLLLHNEKLPRKYEVYTLYKNLACCQTFCGKVKLAWYSIFDIRRKATLRISNWLHIRSKLRGGQLAFYKIVENWSECTFLV